MEYAGLLNSIDNGLWDVESTAPVRRPGSMKWASPTLSPISDNGELQGSTLEDRECFAVCG